MEDPGIIIVQIDESLVQGLRKYNCARLRCRDREPNEDKDSSDKDNVINIQNC